MQHKDKTRQHTGCQYRLGQLFANNIGNKQRSDLVLCDTNNVIVAFCGITNIDSKLRKGEIYTFVNPYEHHKGIGTIAKQLMIEYAFKNLNLNKVYSIVNEDNVPSSRINEKLGFKLEGRIRQDDVNEDGKFRDRLYYGLLQNEYIFG